MTGIAGCALVAIKVTVTRSVAIEAAGGDVPVRQHSVRRTVSAVGSRDPPVDRCVGTVRSGDTRGYDQRLQLLCEIMVRESALWAVELLLTVEARISLLNWQLLLVVIVVNVIATRVVVSAEHMRGLLLLVVVCCD